MATAEEVAESAAAEIAEALTGGGSFVLTGGTSPRRCYELLGGLSVPCGRVAVLFGDERCVPPLDPDSNYRIAKESRLHRPNPRTAYRTPAVLAPDPAPDSSA